MSWDKARSRKRWHLFRSRQRASCTGTVFGPQFDPLEAQAFDGNDSRTLTIIPAAFRAAMVPCSLIFWFADVEWIGAGG